MAYELILVAMDVKLGLLKQYELHKLRSEYLLTKQSVKYRMQSSFLLHTGEKTVDSQWKKILHLL